MKHFSTSKDNAYYPSSFAIHKYYKYLKYLAEYLRYGDFASIIDSFRYTVYGRPPRQDRLTRSRLGTFCLRGSTNDFQFVNWTYEHKVKRLIQKEIAGTESVTFLDVGACIGEYCVWLAKQGVHCIAFEPVKKNYRAVVKNIALNDVGEYVTAMNYGLGKENKEVFFDIKHVVTSSSRWVRDYQGKEANVTIKKLDDAVNTLRIPQENKCVMKLDVEGMEVDVLEGANQFLCQKNRIVIIFEKTSVGRNNVVTFLNSVGDFVYREIDLVNTVAVKQA